MGSDRWAMRVADMAPLWSKPVSGNPAAMPIVLARSRVVAKAPLPATRVYGVLSEGTIPSLAPGTEAPPA
jgi:hypothetical protein